jgi:hypothetical protein
MTDIPVRISFHGLTVKDALESDIRRRIRRLRALHPQLAGCEVVVEVPHRHRHRGRHVRIRLALSMDDGASVVVSHEPEEPANPEVNLTGKDVRDRGHRHARLAIHDAFATARRRLRDRLGIQQAPVTMRVRATPTRVETR